MNRYMNVNEFSKELCVGPSIVYKLIRLRQIPVRKLFIGGRTHIMIPVDQALAMLERNHARDAHAIYV
jgi:hypothetical protein